MVCLASNCGHYDGFLLAVEYVHKRAMHRRGARCSLQFATTCERQFTSGARQVTNDFWRLRLNKLKEGERQTMALLRGETGVGNDKAHRAFSSLRKALVKSGSRILEPKAMSVSEDEAEVLGWLAILQRRRLEPALELRRLVIEEVRSCATCLLELGFRLDYRYAVQALAPERLGSQPGLRGLDPDSPEHGELMSGGRHEFFRVLSERGAMKSSEISELGISRQTISNMVKRGHIRRIGHGLYAMPVGSLQAAALKAVRRSKPTETI